MRKTIITLLAGAAALGASGTALAQGRQAPGQDLARATVLEQAAKAFGRMDANGDGKLDATDREARKQARSERIDHNGDGQIGEADRDARRQQMFARLDANGDGGISYEEFSAMRGPRGEGARAGRPGMQGERMGRRGMLDGAKGLRGIGRNADADGDSVITQDEFTGAMLTRFDAADADKDGIVTAAERNAQRDRRRAGQSG
jgi:hypothetical protein